MSTPIPAKQYIENISSPHFSPTGGILTNDPASGQYVSNLERSVVNNPSTGAYESYIGGSEISTAGVDFSPNANLFSSLQSTFPSLTLNELEQYFNSLTTANPNARQYTSSGEASPYVEGALTTSASVINTSMIPITNSDNTTTTVSRFPTSFPGLLDSIVSYFKIVKGKTVLPVTTNYRESPAYKAFLALFQTYQQTSGVTFNLLSDQDFNSVIQVNDGQNADWDILPDYENPDSNSYGTSGAVATQFENAFAAFLKNFPSKQLENLSSDGTYSLISAHNFLGTWLNFTAATSILQDETKDNALGVFNRVFGDDIAMPTIMGSSGDANQYLLNYESIYKAFFPTDSEADFQKFFQGFYKKILADPANGGYFLPSHFVSQFFEEVKHKYIRPLMGQGADMNTTKPVLSIIWEVLARIQEMVGIIQQLSVFVSQRLTFLTNYQKAYTNLIATIPTIKAGDKIIGGGTSGDEVASTQNSKLSNYRTTLSSYRDQITAQSKGVQSYLDTLSQASSNSLNQGGALLTMLNGLLTIIRAP